MSESVVKNATAKGVGRRVFGLIFLVAVIPMLLTATLSISEFNRGLETEAVKSIRTSAKEYGIRILGRIEQASENTIRIAKTIGSQGSSILADDNYLLEDFEAIWLIREQQQPVLLLKAIRSDSM